MAICAKCGSYATPSGICSKLTCVFEGGAGVLVGPSQDALLSGKVMSYKVKSVVKRGDFTGGIVGVIVESHPAVAAFTAALKVANPLEREAMLAELFETICFFCGKLDPECDCWMEEEGLTPPS